MPKDKKSKTPKRRGTRSTPTTPLSAPTPTTTTTTTTTSSSTTPPTPQTEEPPPTTFRPTTRSSTPLNLTPQDTEEIAEMVESAAAAVQAAPPTRKKRKFKPGTLALREIRSFERTTHLLLPRAPFQRLCREIADEVKQEVRWSAGGLEALHHAAEAFLVGRFMKSNLLAIHRKSITITPKDLQMAQRGLQSEN